MSLVSPLGLYDKHTIKSDELVSTSDLVKFVKLVKLVRLVELDQLFDLIRVKKNHSAISYQQASIVSDIVELTNFTVNFPSIFSIQCNL